MTLQTVHLGFLPLTDAAIPIIAHEMGFAAEQEIALQLTRETSWATLRDRLAIGHFEAAHLLAPLPVASALHLMPLSPQLMVPMALGLGGNAVTLAADLWKAMATHGANSLATPRETGNALRLILQARARASLPKPVFGIVHAFSSHYYDLCYWLAECGINPRRDVAFAVLPPPLMAEAMAAGQLDGYCVGEPWNSVAAVRGVGVIATTKSAIWKDSPEKVLGVLRRWADAQPDTLRALLRAFHRSAVWCADPQNARVLATILALPGYIAQPVGVILPAITGRMFIANAEVEVPGFLSFAPPKAIVARASHAAWFFSQMVRWGQVAWSPEGLSQAVSSFDAQLLSEADPQLPRQSQTVSGFFDGRIFDPRQVEAYLASLPFSEA